MPERVIGEDWAKRYPGRFGNVRTPFDRAVALACPVCGHPTGDCTHEKEGAMPPTKRGTTGGAKQAAGKSLTDPATGLPAADKPTDDDSGKTEVETTTPEDDAPLPVAPTTVEAGQPFAAAPENPVPIEPDGTVNAPYEAVEGGAVNEAGMVAGGGHVASQAATGLPTDGSGGAVPDGNGEERVSLRELGKTSAFAAVEGNSNLVRTVRDVSVEFVPNNAKRTSRILLFPKGRIWTRAEVAARLRDYEDRAEAEVVLK